MPMHQTIASRSLTVYMRARKLLYSVMVCLPAIVVGSTALEAWLRPITYEWPEVSPVQAERLAAYGPLVRDAQALFRDRSSTLERAERLADRWIELVRKGSLRPVYSMNANDGVRVGLKSEVFSARRQLAIRLKVSGAKLAPIDPDRAVLNLLRATEISESFKYGDFDALSSSADDQTEVLSSLSQVLARASSGVQAKVKSKLIALGASLPALQPLVSIASDQELRDDVMRKRAAKLVASFVAKDTSSDILDRIDFAIRDSSSMPEIRFFQMVRAGVESQARFQKALAQISGGDSPQLLVLH